ncbi:MAG: group 1 truncated hemoglobin [Erythrobacter sp.]|jgi:hemoglobin|nr:group 1 truncated hemoglobin [Erythrobacter sp.]
MLLIAATASLMLLQQAPPADIDWDAEFGIETRERDPQTGEYPVDPYHEDNANAGAEPVSGERLAAAFGGREGIERIADRAIDLAEADPRIAAIFVSHDTVRIKRTLGEQLCYLLNAGCDYTGRDMRTSHEGLGLTRADLNALVENLQSAMREAGVPFNAQNRLLARLAPMSKDVIER